MQRHAGPLWFLTSVGYFLLSFYRQGAIRYPITAAPFLASVSTVSSAVLGNVVVPPWLRSTTRSDLHHRRYRAVILDLCHWWIKRQDRRDNWAFEASEVVTALSPLSAKKLILLLCAVAPSPFSSQYLFFYSGICSLIWLMVAVATSRVFPKRNGAKCFYFNNGWFRTTRDVRLTEGQRSTWYCY